MRYMIALAASFVVAAFAQSAAAGEAQIVDGGAKVRAGPGAGYRVIASLPAGGVVDVGRCAKNGQWCRVAIRGGKGWVAFSRLAFPHTGRPGEENYEIGVEGQSSGDYAKILGIVVDKPGYCYAVNHSGVGIIVKCP